MAQERYAYVSFSKPKFTPELDRLIDASRNWSPIRGKVVDGFDFDGWMREARAAFDFGADSAALSCSGTAAVARRISDILLLDRYRRGPQENVLAHPDAFVDRIADHVEVDKPVTLVIPSFPGRPVSPLTHARMQPDLGELASFTRLWTMSEHVRTVYEPGLRFVIVLDGQAYAPFYGYTPEAFRAYPEDLRTLLDRLGIGGTIELVDLQSLVDERRDEFEKLYPEVDEELRAEWARTEYPFRDELVDSMKLGTNTAAINAAAVKLVKYYGDAPAEEAVEEMRSSVAQRACETAYAYMCFLVTTRRMGLIKDRFPGAIRATVHPKPGQYSPHLVNDTTDIVPWHGVAVRRPDGRVDSVYESRIFEEPHRYVAVYLRGEYTPFYYEEEVS
jgi:L-tyrosine isonitrile synthase